MSFPRYPAYKDSRVEWLGDVPEHWSTSKLGFETWVRARLGWKGLKADEYVDEGFAFLSTPNIKGGEIDFENVNFISQPRFNESPEIRLAQGDVLLAKDGSTLGIVNVIRRLPRPTTVNSSIAVITPQESLDSVFLFYLLAGSGIQQVIQQKKGGMGVPHLFQADLVKFQIPIPPKSEQLALAIFLDRETAKIDALIAEQQRLIELLQEKRQAVISHAVTKGLNPNAPMKDSGVEWIGEVPKHWEVCSLSHTLKAIGDVDHYMPSTVAEGVPYLMTGDLQELTSQIDFNDCKQVSHEEYEKLSRKIKTANGDLIMARYATIGTVAYVDVERDLLVSYSCVTMKPNMDRTCGMFLFYCLKSDSFSQGIKHKINANTQENVGIGDLKKVKVAIPPLNEQQQISEYLQAAITEMTKVIQASKDTVRLLHERRSALISAAVTGQIDVRGLVKSEAGEQ